MMEFTVPGQDAVVSFQEDAEIQLCPYCGMPNEKEVAYCTACARSLQTAREQRNLIAKASEVLACPHCGRYHLQDAAICPNSNCGYAFQQAQQPAPPEASEETVYVKYCPHCRHENSVAAEECARCGADLSLALETERVAPNTLYNLTTAQVTVLHPAEQLTIGRGAGLSAQLQGCDYVSASHADLFCRDGTWLIRDHSRNGTYVNGQRIEANTEVALDFGAVISLGDASPEQPLAAHYRVGGYAD